jgi:pSer/pThr/pTyr-binding forkhead associated (FHA) protein
VFVLVAVRSIRSDLSGKPAAVPMSPPPSAKAAAPPKAPKPQRRKGAPRRLVVTEGTLQGTTVTLAGTPVTLGRADDSTLVLTDDYASNKHARLVPNGDDTWTLEDLGSTNGTYLGTAKVARPTVVPVGTPIRIGKTVLELRP